MPSNVEAFVEEGFASLTSSDRETRQEILRKLLEVTPPALIDKDTRSGPHVVYRVPEGNARQAGLLDDAVEKPITYKKDLHFQQELVDADPRVSDRGGQHGEFRTITPTIADHAYQAMPTNQGPVQDGHVNLAEPQPANGIIRADLRPNKNVVDADDVPQPPEYSSIPAARLQQKIRENTIRPADYAPGRVPRNERVPVAQGTIAAVVDRTTVDPSPQTVLTTPSNVDHLTVNSGPAPETSLTRPDPILEQRAVEGAGDPDASATSPEPAPATEKSAPAKKAVAKKAPAKKAPAKKAAPKIEGES